ncbi:MAG: phytanoyl-CoA dioxygenase family protein [Oscillatoria sp. SIO1A7]|nr:phytanoyl-CoA dioxygenase family protein [Oscillatoria sp. SIO1A7]
MAVNYSNASDNSEKELSLQNINSEDDNIHTTWQGSNEEWWDWYVSLADNSSLPVNKEKLIHFPNIAFKSSLSIEDFKQQLAEPYPLSEQQIEQFKTESYIRLKNVLSPEAVYLLRQEAQYLLNRCRQSNPSQQFFNIEMMWLENEVMREFALSSRLARIAAELLEVSSVRLYHDNVLCKNPGCGRTPWHYDLHHFPIASTNICSHWLPLQAMPWEMGIIEFACGMEVYKIIEQVPCDKSGKTEDFWIARLLQSNNIKINRDPFELGEISFHHGFNVHGAAANRTTQPRMAITKIYFENGDRLINSSKITSGSWRKFIPNTKPSEMISNPYNFILYSV